MSDSIFCIIGPTASGKTDLALALEQEFNFEIISVDSALIYRDMNIGTAKPSTEILNSVKHHLIDIINPNEMYNVANFLQDANAIITDIKARGKIPLLVGGTMMYFNALQHGLSSLPESDVKVRSEIEQLIAKEGLEHAYQKLLSLDPIAQRININDTQRIIRALEVCLITGKPFSSFHEKVQKSSHNIINFALLAGDRALLHDKIATRFKMMLELGLIDEVKMLIDKYQLNLSYPAMKSVGYRQVYMYLSNELDRDMLEYKAVVATRQLAKRQLTWLRSKNFEQSYQFICENPNLTQEVMAKVREILDNNHIVSGV